MRRLIAIAALAAMTVPISGNAEAVTVTKFSARQRVSSYRFVGHHAHRRLVIRGRLVRPHHRHDLIGRYRYRFGFRRRHLREVFFFPDGKIKAVGKLNHLKIPIVGGTGAWNGASGKIKFSDPTVGALLHFTVIRTR